MTLQEIQDRIEIRELTDVFANLADTKEVEKRGDLSYLNAFRYPAALPGCEDLGRSDHQWG